MGRLTTHVLDTARGRPAAGIPLELYRETPDGWVSVATAVTNADGRTDAPILPPGAFAPGVYELRFHAGAYLAASAGATGFLDVIPIRFGIADEHAHYHVPLLLAPHGYSTYRGS